MQCTQSLDCHIVSSRRCRICVYHVPARSSRAACLRDVPGDQGIEKGSFDTVRYKDTCTIPVVFDTIRYDSIHPIVKTLVSLTWKENASTKKQVDFPRPAQSAQSGCRVGAHFQCSNLLYKVHRSHRCTGAKVHRNGVPWHPLHRRQRGISMHSYENRSQIRAL